MTGPLTTLANPYNKDMGLYPGAPTSRLPQFGLTSTVSHEAAAQIKNLRTAEFLAEKMKFQKLHTDPRFWNLSMQDLLSRLNVALAVYLPATYLSLSQKKHAWETNGRNAMLWFATLGVAIATKHPKYGLNPLLNPLMRQKVTADTIPAELSRLKNELELLKQDPTRHSDKINKLGKIYSKLETQLTKPSIGTKLLNKLRPNYDYYKLLEEAKIGKFSKYTDRQGAWWASPDRNQLKTLEVKLQGLKESTQKGLKLTETDQAFLKNAPKFLNRISSMRVLATLLNMALTVYVIGILVMEVVFRWIAPRDHDFDPTKYRNGKHHKSEKATPPTPPANAGLPPFSQVGVPAPLPPSQLIRPLSPQTPFANLQAGGQQ